MTTREERTQTLPASEQPEGGAASETLELGPYVVAGEIGRGGGGRVLEAWDTRLGRAVALKAPLHGSRAAQARFAREATLTARLQHPGVVPIYEAGETPEGEPYYAMRFVAGRSLREMIDERPTLEARLALLPAVLAAADTVAYAHSRSIVHRDLKPANVLVGAFGETVVIDWGLGKSLDDDEPGDEADGARGDDVTLAGAVLGTPAFMPPEQAAGEPVDVRADVYALGAILYNVLTGAPPYEATSVDDSLAAVRRAPPTPVSVREPRVPRDLAAIVEQAMARDREQRYASAAPLADDLRRFHTGQLVRAHRYSRLALARRWVRRHAVATAIAAVAVLAVLAAVQIRSARRRADARADSLRLAEAGRRLAQDPARALVELSRYSRDGGEWPRVAELAIEAARLGLPDWVAPVGPQAAAAFAPDGATLAVATPRALAMFDAATGAQRAWPLQLEPFDAIAALSWSGDRLVAALHSGALVIVTGERRRSAPCSPAPITAAVADASVVVAGAEDGSVTRCDLEADRAAPLHRHAGAVARVALAGARAFSIGRDGVVAAVSLDGTSRAQRDLGVGSLSVLAARAAHGGVELAVGTEAGDLLVVDGDALVVRRRLQHFDARFVELAWLAAADALVVATSDHVVRTIRLDDGGEFTVGPGDSFAQSTAGDWIAAAGTDGLVTLFDPRTAWRRTLKAHAAELQSIAVSPDGRLATVGADGTARLWGRSNRPERLYRFDGTGAYIDTVPGRDDIAIASDTGELQLCLPSGHCVATRLPTAAPALVRMGAVADPIAVADLAVGDIHLFDRELASLGRISLGEPLRDIRTRGSRALAVARSGALYVVDARDRSVERVALGGACPRAARVRWSSDHHALLACSGALVTFDLAARTATSTEPTGDAEAGIAGTGALRDGALLALLDTGELRRLGRVAQPLFHCATRGGRLFEASDGGAWLNDCGGRVRVVDDDGRAVESVELARSAATVADMDASAERRDVAVGFVDRLVVWNYRDETVKVAGSSLAVYNVEVAGARIVAASSPGSVQLWDLSGAPAIPMEPRSLGAWLGAQVSRYRFEQEDR